MNIENFKLVRQAVADNPVFDMVNYIHLCGSAACIMGSAAKIIGPSSEVKGPLGRGVDSIAVSKWFGIDNHEYRHVSLGFWINKNRPLITKAQALAYLDKVIETGNVMVTIDADEVV